MNARLAWAMKLTDPATQHLYLGNSTTLIVHVDEKWFYAYHVNEFVYLPAGVRPHRINVQSKTQIPKVMFLAAVSNPVPEHGWDGHVAMIPITEYRKPRRNSRNHSTSEFHHYERSLDSKLFVRLIKKIISRLVPKVESWCQRIIVQFDSAGGHGGGRSANIPKTVTQLTEWIVRNPIIPASMDVSVRTQPAKSPDLNVLDLGAWWSLQAPVLRVKYTAAGGRTQFDRIVKTVVRVWNNWAASQKLTKLYSTLKEVARNIIADGGGNRFELGHSKKGRGPRGSYRRPTPPQLDYEEEEEGDISDGVEEPDFNLNMTDSEDESE